MNYSKIYDDLINHRKYLPRLTDEYYELHHIVPRGLGGGDEPENLIYLTAEDHFVAHLLLGKVYGGKMWSAAHMMMYGNNNHSRQDIRHNRASFALVRKEHCKAMSDLEVYHVVDIETNTEYKGTQKQLVVEIGISAPAVCKVVRGGIYGPFVLYENVNTKFKRKVRVRLINIKHKFSYYGSWDQLRRFCGIDLRDISFLEQGILRKGVVIDNFIDSYRKMKNHLPLCKFLDTATNKEFICTTKELMKEYGVTPSSARQMLYGRIKKSKGIMFICRM